MTTDYAKLDTAALMAAAEALTAGITPGTWEVVEWSDKFGTDTMLYIGADSSINLNDIELTRPDAAFIAAAPALVSALLARLRECEGVPEPCKFKVGDKVKAVNMRYGTGVDADRFPAGKVFTVKAIEYSEGLWQIETDAKETTDWLAYFLESELELVTNG